MLRSLFFGVGLFFSFILLPLHASRLKSIPQAALEPQSCGARFLDLQMEQNKEPARKAFAVLMRDKIKKKRELEAAHQKLLIEILRPLEDAILNQAISLFQKTNCHETAHSVTSLLTGEYQPLIPSSKENLQNSYVGNKKSFLKSAFYQELFSDGSERAPYNHTIYYVSINPYLGDHSYVIEKKPIDGNTKWRIYQSCQDHFTLPQWMGIAKWRKTKTPFDQWRETYGKGKWLTKEQVASCFDLMLNPYLQYKHWDSGPELYITKYQFSLSSFLKNSVFSLY